MPVTSQVGDNYGYNRTALASYREQPIPSSPASYAVTAWRSG